MVLEVIKEDDKRILERLAIDFAKDLTNSHRREVHLYGAEKGVLSFFREKLDLCGREKGRKIEIGFGEDGPYNIDVGYFLKRGYFQA